MSFAKKTLAILALAASPTAASAVERGGNVLGWVQDSQGMPVSGVLISVFAKGMRDGGFVTVSDAAGRFVLTSLPAGSYTLRAVGRSHLPAPARQVTVLPDQDSIFSVSLKALRDLTDEQISARVDELKWLERHKRRSVLEERDATAIDEIPDETPAMNDFAERLGHWLSDVSGSVEFVANSSALGAPPNSSSVPDGAFPGGSGVVQLTGQITDTTSFTVGGLLAETGTRSWRMAGEFVIEPGGGHQIQTGAGYGTRLLHSPSTAEEDIQGASVGAVFAQDRWSLGRLALTAGARHSYIGFVGDQNRNHTDPLAIVEFSAGQHTNLRAGFTTRTLAPGGDLLTLSTLAAAPAIAYAMTDDGLRPQRTIHYEFAVARELGRTRLEARAFREDTRDQLINAFAGYGPTRSLRIFNGSDLSASGLGFEVSHRFGDVVKGSVTYSYGSWRDVGEKGTFIPFIGGGSEDVYRQASFHDLAALVETHFEWTDTRLVAYYRWNTLRPGGPEGGAPTRSTHFDIQLSQGLPFIGTLTRADWDVLVAYRNLFYETAEGGLLDEVAVVNPPKRVLGGISVRF